MPHLARPRAGLLLSGSTLSGLALSGLAVSGLALSGLAPIACSPPPQPAAPIDVPTTTPSSAPTPKAVTETPEAGVEAAEAAALAKSPPTPIEDAIARWTKLSQCDDYNYFPNGGIRNFWCNRPADVTLKALHQLAGVDVFASGPHKDDTLDLDAKTFGHYNPAFVHWLVDHAVSERGSPGQKATQAAYDASVKPLAEIFWKTYEKSTSDPKCFAREKASYALAMANKKTKGFVERWYYFMNPQFCKRNAAPNDFDFYYENGGDFGVDGNVTKTVMGFWLRRSMDGTYDVWVEALKKLIAAYQPELLEKPTRFPDGDAIDRALDAGVKAAATRCKTAKTPSAPSAPAAVAITVSPDGSVSANLAFRGFQGSPQNQCVADAFGAQTVPPFDGPKLGFNRKVSVPTLPRTPGGAGKPVF